MAKKFDDKPIRKFNVNIKELKEQSYLTKESKLEKKFIGCDYCSVLIKNKDGLCKGCKKYFCDNCIDNKYCNRCTKKNLIGTKCMNCNYILYPFQMTHCCHFCKKVLCYKCSITKKCCNATYTCNNCDIKLVKCNTCLNTFCTEKCKGSNCETCNEIGCKRCKISCTVCNKSLCEKCNIKHIEKKCNFCKTKTLECSKCVNCNKVTCKKCGKICDCCGKIYCEMDYIKHNSTCNHCNKNKCCDLCEIDEGVEDKQTGEIKYHKIKKSCSVCNKSYDKSHIVKLFGCHIETCSITSWLALCCKDATEKNIKKFYDKFPNCKMCGFSFCSKLHLVKNDNNYYCKACDMFMKLKQDPNYINKLSDYKSKEKINEPESDEDNTPKKYTILKTLIIDNKFSKLKKYVGINVFKNIEKYSHKIIKLDKNENIDINSRKVAEKISIDVIRKYLKMNNKIDLKEDQNIDPLGECKTKIIFKCGDKKYYYLGYRIKIQNDFKLFIKKFPNEKELLKF